MLISMIFLVFTCTLQNWITYMKYSQGGSSKILYGEAQSRLQNFDYLYTSKSVILWLASLYQIAAKTPNLEQIGCFFGLIFQNTSNFANWTHWVLNGNPPIDIPIMTKKHLLTFEHSLKPSTSEVPGLTYNWEMLNS